MFILGSTTAPGWFSFSRRHLGALLSDHLHCERKAAENALSLVRRYPRRASFVERLTRLAHEETSHLVQVAALIQERGLVRGREPERQVDALLCAALIEARSHERLSLLAQGFAAERDERLAAFYGALASAEERHAELFVTLAEETVSAAEVANRLDDLRGREAEILAALPHGSRIH